MRRAAPLSAASLSAVVLLAASTSPAQTAPVGAGSMPSPAAEATAPDSLDLIAQTYVKLILGIGEVEPGYVDAYYGPADWAAAAKAAPRTKRLIALVGPRPNGQMAWGGEAILADGKPVGEITSAAFGASLDGIVALGWASSDQPIDQGWLDARSWAIDLAGTSVPVSASLAAPLDRKAR